MSRAFDKRVLRINCAGVLKTYWWCPDCGEMVKPVPMERWAGEPDDSRRLERAADEHRFLH